MKKILGLAFAPLLGILFWMPGQPPVGGPGNTPGPGASAGADISNTGAGWGKTAVYYQQNPDDHDGLVTVGYQDYTGQNNPYSYVSVPAARENNFNFKNTSVDSTVVFYYSGSGTATTLTFDADYNVGDFAYDQNQVAISHVYGPGNDMFGRDNGAPNPEMYPHDFYNHALYPTMVPTDPDEIRQEVHFTLDASVSSHR